MYGHLRSYTPIALAALFAASLSLTGCGGEEETPGETTAEDATQAVPPTEQEPATPPDTSPDTAPSEAPPDSQAAAPEEGTAMEPPPEQQTEPPADEPVPAEAPAGTEAPADQAAAGGGGEDTEAAMQQAGCLACHQVEQKVIGPAYAWVAHRYQGDDNAAETLVQSIKQGSQGKWTDVTGGAPMPPNPQVSDEQATAFAQWILEQEPQEPPQ